MVTIKIPKSMDHEIIDLESINNIIIVGANGSGKSRFGSKIEQSNPNSKRISAQRNLQLQEVVQKEDYETADNHLKKNYKNQAVTEPQNDIQQVLKTLFAEEARRNENVVKTLNTKGELVKADMPNSIKEKVIEVWSKVFPHRPLNLEKDKIRAIAMDDTEFSGTQMSDGEKVGLYLIAQVLLAEQNCILIIDEPELHLHKALMTRLRNKLEENRPDCTFIYITHDLGFASNKPSTKIIWIKSYHENHWDWEELDKNGTIPEDLYLEVLGSRQPILFVEGERGSIDIQIYQSVYEDFTVIPCGSCKKVIESVRGLKGNTNMHDKQVFGIIDRDFLPEEQLQSLESDGIYHTGVNKIENLFLLPDVVDLVCSYQSQAEKKDVIINRIIDIYNSRLTEISFSASKNALYREMNESLGSLANKEDYETWKSLIIAQLDLLIQQTTLETQTDIIEILKVYPHKGLVREVQGEISLSKNGYQALVLGFINSDKREAITTIFKQYLPQITSTKQGEVRTENSV